MRTNEQKAAIATFHRGKNKYAIIGNKLTYQGKEIIKTEDIPDLVRREFQKKGKCGSRTLSTSLGKTYMGLSEMRISKELKRSAKYQ